MLIRLSVVLVRASGSPCEDLLKARAARLEQQGQRSLSEGNITAAEELKGQATAPGNCKG
jgi:hypothetical protein